MQRLRASSLALPLIAFLLVTFVVPIASLIRLSYYDSTVADALPLTTEALRNWDGQQLPPSQTYETLANELIAAREARTLGKIASRINRVISGTRSTITKTPRRMQRQSNPNARQAMIDIDSAWGEVAIWTALQRVTQTHSIRNFLQALDFTTTEDGSIGRLPENERVYVTLYLRTLGVSAAVTLLCFVIGYPMAYAMAHASKGMGRVLLVLVLIPFWTSLLVRTTSWIVILQQQGVLNDLLVFVGIVDDSDRLTMVHNLTGTLIAMTQVLLPFMILPLYAVMNTIPDNLSRAAHSLGANPLQAFVRVYFPQSMPGVAAGALLVFILSIGYYITPALVGGSKGQLISNLIAYHLQTSLNWGLAAALSVILLVGVFVLYVIYDKLVGVDRLKLG